MPSHYLNQCWIIVKWTLWTNFSEILIEIRTFTFKKMRLKMSSAKRRPFCLGLNVLTEISFCSHVYAYEFIAANFWIRNDSCVVVACVTICSDLIARHWITTTKIDFPRIWITNKIGESVTKSLSQCWVSMKYSELVQSSSVSCNMPLVRWKTEVKIRLLSHPQDCICGATSISKVYFYGR